MNALTVRHATLGGKGTGLSLPARPTKLPVTYAAKLAPCLPAVSRDELFQQFPLALRKLETMARQQRDFLREIVSCNTTVQLLINKESIDDRMDQLLPDCGSLACSVKDIAALENDTEVRGGLQEIVTDSAVKVSTQLFAGLSYLSDAEVIGQFAVNGNGVCSFYGYRWMVKEFVSGVQRTTTETRTDITRTLHQRLDYRELRNASFHAIDDPSIPKPARVERLIAKVPTFLKPLVKIVNGQQMFRHFLEREVSTERRTVVEKNEYKPDPALVIGPYCVTVW